MSAFDQECCVICLCCSAVHDHAAFQHDIHTFTLVHMLFHVSELFTSTGSIISASCVDRCCAGMVFLERAGACVYAVVKFVASGKEHGRYQVLSACAVIACISGR